MEFDGICPHCKADLTYMVEGKKYSRLAGIEDPMKFDGISWWSCPECGKVWDRFTGKIESWSLITKEEKK